MARQVFQAINLRYEGQPTITITVDGVALVTDQQLPNHASLSQRRIPLPPGGVGYEPQVQTSFTKPLNISFESVPEQAYANQQLFHYYEVQFKGTVEVEIYADEVQKTINNSSLTRLSLSTRDNREQDTRRVFFPPLTYGWFPQLKAVVNPLQDGQVLSERLRMLPARFSRGLKDHAEVQVTHQGSVLVDVVLDGRVIQEFNFPPDPFSASTYITEKEYLPSGSRGHVLQWIQTSGDGEIAVFETDTTLTDRDQPQAEI